MLQPQKLSVGDQIELNVESDHWDALFRLEGEEVVFHVLVDGHRFVGHLVELLNSPRVVVRIEEKTLIQ